MIEKYSFGQNIETDAVVNKMNSLPCEQFSLGRVKSSWPFEWEYELEKDAVVFGLGENMRGMNKRGFSYTSFCSDVPNQDESTHSMYGAHNFLIVFSRIKTFGLFFDTASEITFDIDWTKSGVMNVSTKDTGLDLYVIYADSCKTERKESALDDITRQFRTLIGQSYIPPKWAFGFQQSRWGYKTEEDVLEVAKRHREASLPLDMICLDIDYMQDYKDFTVDKKKFPDLKKLSDDLKKEGIRLVPIIDAGVKAQKGYDVYEEGIAKGYFCKREDGSVFTAGVWPGASHFTDFCKKEASDWFGSKYKLLTDMGIEGFWNDMNEPAMFYSSESLKNAFDKIKEYSGKDLDINSFFEFKDSSCSTFNRRDDYERFYHQVTDSSGETKKMRHDKIHNIYGSFMTRAAALGLKKACPQKRFLLYSRASCIGSHRYGGIWTGDNKSLWCDLLQEIKMLPGLNMAGFLYNGADIGGFGCDTSRDLLLRWLALGCFTPLMRNHCALGGRLQEAYRFEGVEDFKSVMDLRYALVPYIYSEFVKAALTGGMYIKPLAFEWPEDDRAINCEDQLLVGEGIMIAPVYTQNARGRYVYLPEDMTMVTWRGGKFEQTLLAKGDHFINVPVETVVFFVRSKKLVPLCKPAPCTEKLDTKNFTFAGDGTCYELYDDDGFSLDIDLKKGTRSLTPEL